uniref:Uncharacterized protein n=1 Tax=Candidatus Kentrum sp. FW TaxID=2126338 RepID=A0A450TUJ2_9GAMM|nr:MAG: hypothetical protein BECKFW1821C_GA0114237_103515 [Candidatus Kentron sp. FW]
MAHENPQPPPDTLTQLIESANRSAEHLQRAHLQFTLVWTYYILVVSTTTHRDLLLEGARGLPISNLNISMPIEIAYVFGPPFIGTATWASTCSVSVGRTSVPCIAGMA